MFYMLTLFRDSALYQKYKREETGMKLQKRQPRTGTIHRVAFKTDLWITFSVSVFLPQFKTGLMIVHVL